MPTKQKTCRERIRGEWNDREANLNLYMNDSEVNESGNDDLPPFNEYGLGFDYVPAQTFEDQETGYWRYQFSWGGPSDELRFYGDAQSHVYKVEYWFLDWFDGAHINVTKEPCAQWLIEEFSGMEMFAYALKEATA